MLLMRNGSRSTASWQTSSGSRHALWQLRVSLTSVGREEADKLADMAHAGIRPYSRATRGNLDVRVNVEP